MIRDTGMIAAPIGDAAVSVVDVRDYAPGPATALTENGHLGRIDTLTGREVLTHAGFAEKLSATTGPAIAFADASEDDLRPAIAGIIMPEWQIEGLIEDFAHYHHDEWAVIATGVRGTTGCGPPASDGFARD